MGNFQSTGVYCSLNGFLFIFNFRSGYKNVKVRFPVTLQVDETQSLLLPTPVLPISSAWYMLRYM